MKTPYLPLSAPPPPTFRIIGANSQYPSLHWQAAPPPAQPLKNDCDLDHDGLIDIGSLHQLYALRWDLDGDGTGGEPVALPHFSRLPDFSRLPGAELGGRASCIGVSRRSPA